MLKAKRILITTESHEVFIVRNTGKSDLHGYCERCATETEMLTIDEAVTFAKNTTRNLMTRIESGTIHSIETASGHLLICGSSL